MYKVLSARHSVFGIKYWVLSMGFALLLATFYLLLFGAPALAATTPTNFDSGFSLQPDCDPTLPPNAAPGPKGPPCNIDSIIALIKKIINYLFYISIPIAAGFIVYGAFVMITSGGNPTGFQKGKTVIVAAIIGITIMLTANLLVGLVVSILKGATK